MVDLSREMAHFGDRLSGRVHVSVRKRERSKDVKSDTSKVVVRLIVVVRAAGVVCWVALGNDDDHALAGAGQEDSIGVL